MGESGHVAAGVVSGIGFLGAGAIIREGGRNVAGMTTAATVWMTASIGLIMGLGMYILAAAATALAFIVLRFFPRAADLDGE
jgi:putative Mg2+ transporter-C (MgtC) family protein